MDVHKFYGLILPRFRAKRMAIFCKCFSIEPDTSILDMGGGIFNWTMILKRPRLTILDVFEHQNKAEWATYIVGDGCKTEFPSNAFDIVFSNSVIEHVGGQDRQKEFASECMRCGRGFFVQTPNKWFPVDTHTLLPFVHWLPQKIFRKFLPFAPRFVFFKSDPGDMNDFANMRLLTKRDMESLFPGAEIIEEKFWGITKILISIKQI